MSAAVLRIGVEGGADVRRALGTIVAEARRANATMNADARRGARERTRDSEREARDAARVFERSMAARRRLQRQATADARAEARDRLHTEQTTEAHVMRMDTMRTRHAQNESNQRRRIDREEARERERTADRAARRMIQQQREATRQVREMERGRVAESRRMWGGVGAVVRFAGGAASGINSAVQGARAEYASPEHAVGSALYQAGGGAGEARGFRDRIFGFLQGAGRGLRFEQVANALNQAQTEFSVLGNRGSGNAQTRAAALDDVLRDMALARNTYQDPGEVTRVSGLLRQSGLNPTQRRQTLLALTGMAQAGAVELSGVTRQAMAPLQSRIGQALAALPANATEQQRQETIQRTIGQGFAEIEVARSLGMTPRAAGNALANMQGALRDPITGQRMLTNVQNFQGISEGQRDRIMGALFRGGRLREGLDNPLALMGALQGAGVDSTTAQNLFRGGGHGNPQSMQANWRRMLGAMLGEDAEGTSGAERVRRLMAPGTAITEADVIRGAGMVGQEQNTELAANESRRAQLLTDNTNAMVTLSNAFARWQAEHPFISAAPTPGLPGAGGGTTTGAVTGAAGATIAARAGGGALLNGGALAGAAAVVGGALFAGYDLLTGGKGSDAAQRMINPEGGDPSRATRTGGLTTWRDPGVWRDVARWFTGPGVEVFANARDSGGPIRDAAGLQAKAAANNVRIAPGDIQALVAALERAQLTVDPHTATHVATENRSFRNSRQEN